MERRASPAGSEAVQLVESVWAVISEHQCFFSESLKANPLVPHDSELSPLWSSFTGNGSCSCTTMDLSPECRCGLAPVFPPLETANTGLEVLLVASCSQQLRLDQVVPPREALPPRSSSMGKKSKRTWWDRCPLQEGCGAQHVGVVPAAQTSSPGSVLSRADRAFISAGAAPVFLHPCFKNQHILFLASSAFRKQS